METDDTYRRSVEELTVRYAEHPEMRDLYVEGSRDAAFFKWFFAKVSGLKVAVYTIDTVSIPNKLMMMTGVELEGHRGRVIALSVLLERALNSECLSVICCVDKDFHDYGYSLPVCRYLIYTDFPSLEAYTASPAQIQKVFLVYLGRALSSEEMESMMEVLTLVFGTRLMKRRVAAEARWFGDFTKCCSIINGRICIDVDTYSARISSVAGRQLIATPMPASNPGGSAAMGDARQAIHGHDLVQMIEWVARKKGVRSSFVADGVLQRAMFSSVELQDIVGEQMFIKLSSWAAS